VPTPATRTQKKKTNARGRRQSHAARLTTEPTSAPAPLVAEGTSARRDRGAEMRERILHAALECFGAFGFAGTSTRAVADRTGISHPLLIYHFQSKEQLWRSTLGDVIARYRAQLDARLARADADDPRARLQAFIENFVEFSARTPQLHRIMTQQSTQGSERIAWLIEGGLRDSFEQICRLIRRGQAAGIVRRGDPARLYYSVIGLGGTPFSVSNEVQLLTGRDVFDPAELRAIKELIYTFLFVPA
jgi:TetR/AcrR family transcriptional regulator